MYKKYIKRMLDVLISFVALVVFFPFLLLLMLLVRINLGAPVIFKQKRVGKEERVFTMYKFRTMSEKRDEMGNLLPDEERQTRFGNFLRSTSLDELPELLNILKGDISIVGPRPLLVEYLPFYTERERIRHTVRGGLTVPEVIYGNVTPTWEEQFEYEVKYAENVSFVLDVKIIMHTILILFKRIETNYGSEIRKPLNIERSGESQKEKL